MGKGGGFKHWAAIALLLKPEKFCEERKCYLETWSGGWRGVIEAEREVRKNFKNINCNN